jgi:hypothetical protein
MRIRITSHLCLRLGKLGETREDEGNNDNKEAKGKKEG